MVRKKTQKKPTPKRKKALRRRRVPKRKKVLRRERAPKKVVSRREKRRIPAGAPLVLVWLKKRKIGPREVGLVAICLILIGIIAFGWDKMSFGDRLIAGLGAISGVLMAIGALISR